MRKVDLRCALALHGRLDPELVELDIKCKDCSRAQHRPIHHRWKLLDVIEQLNRGDVVGICEPTDPRFVHWKVTGS